MEDDLDATVRRADPDRWLASCFVGDAAARADLIALYAFDNELARALTVTREALMSEIRLTWWSEALGEIYAGKAVRRHPVALALETAIRRRDLPRPPLEALIDARLSMLDGVIPDLDDLLTAVAVELLGGDPAAAPRSLPPEVFPAVAHRVLKGSAGGGLSRRLRITWAVLRGRV